MITPFEATAAPTSDELVQLCKRALNAGYRGRLAQNCTWYAIPCDCDGPSANSPRVCIPVDVPSKKIAEQVTELLQALPEYRAEDGRRAAATVLSVVYPCTE